MLTIARGRRLDLQRVETALRALEVELRLLALALLGHDVGFGGGLVGLRLRFGLAQLQLGVGHGQLRLLVLELRHQVALSEIELRAIEVVPRLHHRRLVLLLRDPLLRLRPARSRRRTASARTASPASAASAWSHRTRRARRRPSRRVPFFASLTIWSSPAWIGAESTIDFAGRMSPRSWR